MKKCLLIFSILFISSIKSFALTKMEADSAYAKAHYEDAVSVYEQLLKKGSDEVLYYNLGNSYYRLNNIPKAILNYERALVLDPGDSDIRFNLALARSKNIDKIPEEGEMFFLTWFHSLVNTMSVDGWGNCALGCFMVALLLLSIYFFTHRVGLRKIGFFGALIMFMIVLLSNIFAYRQKQQLLNRNEAIIMNTVKIKSTPNESGTDLFILHEGTKVKIIDNSLRDWKEVSIAGGKEGWMPAHLMEII